ncbi:MAG: hypothetical protein CL930_15940 [Deltaproteobacteria bacterium]|nr:hypothetical protein [Deltaproteobacteria bacterium]
MYSPVVLKGLKPTLIGPALGIGLALLVLYPGWLTANTRLVGHEGLDVWSHAWGIRWIFNALMDGNVPWDVDGLAWPRGGILWYIDPLGALVSLPGQMVSGPVLGHNSILFLQIALAGWAAFGLSRALGGRGYIAATALATAPTFLAEIHNGTVEACWIGLVPLAVWAAVRNRWWCGSLVGLASLATPYHGIAAALLVGTVLLFAPHEKQPPHWPTRLRRTAMAAGLAMVVALPAFLILKASLDDPLGIAKKSIAMLNFPVFRINAVDPVALFHPGDFWTVNLVGETTTPFRRTPYLGLTILCLSSVLMIRQRKQRWWLIPVFITVIFALGPFLWHDGDFVRTQGGELLALPFRWVLGFGVVMDHPLRFISGAVTVLAVLADVTAKKLEGKIVLPRAVWTFCLAGIVLVEHLVLSPNVWPLSTADGSIPAVYSGLNAPGAIIDLPAARGQSIATNRYLYWQGIHRHPIPYSHKVGPDLPNVNSTLRTWADLSRDVPRHEHDPGRVQGTVDHEMGVKKLARSGFRWVILHQDLLANEQVARDHQDMLYKTLGTPESIGNALVWSIPQPVETTE